MLCEIDLVRNLELEELEAPHNYIIRHTKSRAVYTVVYTALQGKFYATLTGMEKGNASSFTKRCLFQLTVQIIEF